MDYRVIFINEVLPYIKTAQPNIIKCSRCKKDYGEDKFKFNEKKHVFSKQCMMCQEKQMKYVMKHYNKHRENDEYREKVKGYREKHKQTQAYKQYCEERKKDNKVQERKRMMNREWKRNNPEKVKEYAKRNYQTYYAKHKHTLKYKTIKRLRVKKYISTTRGKKQRNIYQTKRRKGDIRVSLRDNVSRRIIRSLKSTSKSECTIKYLGCSIECLVEHLENQFEYGMSWDNYGRKKGVRCWEIDHIVPIHYDNPTLDEVIERLQYTNCQPMWAELNRSKGNRYMD